MVREENRARLAREGDLSAFNELVVEYQGLVYNVCYRMLGQTQAAEDATQEAFVSAWRNIATMRGEAFRPWLLRIATNLCRDELRRRTRRPSSSLDVALEAGVPEPPDADPLPEDRALNRELRAGLDAALALLPEDQRTAIVLCDVEGLDYSEIASVMKTSLGTVKSRIARGRLRLREALLRQPELLPGRFRQGD
ncbi:MAG TPA: sigma-70 family RNA polymerase sigma factor [Dehalococcoidia bacterium]|nr:sigma-70 family RNA polymerase sigma factor [Dehalococcoidia bacterium]